MLELEPGMLIWTWVTFIILLALLYKVAWKPLVRMIDERDQAIADALKKAEQSREEAQSLLAEQKEKMKQTHEEVKKIIENSKKTAEQTRKEIVGQAREEAEKIIERGKTDIERERRDAIGALKQDISSLVVGAVAKLVGISLDEPRHHEIIEDSIKKLGQN